MYKTTSQIEDYINNKLYVEIHSFPAEMSYEIVTANKIYLFVHTNVNSSKEDPF